MVVLFLVWIVVVSAGLFGLSYYSNQPGESAAPPKLWPASSQVLLDSEHPTLLFFAHPYCSCTEASARELESVIAHFGRPLSLNILVIRSREFDRDRQEPALVDRLKQLPGTKVFEDLNAEETRQFGVTTSGHVLLYAPDGRLLFSGGVTASRGHAGENENSLALGRLLSQSSRDAPAAKSCDVFGCPLFPLATPAAQGTTR